MPTTQPDSALMAEDSDAIITAGEGLPRSLSPKSSSQYPNLALLVVVVGVLITAIDTTIVVLALPEIQRSLHIGLTSVIWVIIGYLLVITVLSTQVGRLGDMYGRVHHDRLAEALGALLDNALRHIGTGAVVTIAATRHNTHCQIVATDNSEGLDPAIVDNCSSASTWAIHPATPAAQEAASSRPSPRRSCKRTTAQKQHSRSGC